MNSYSKAGEAIKSILNKCKSSASDTLKKSGIRLCNDDGTFKRLEDILKDYSINESVIRHDL